MCDRPWLSVLIPTYNGAAYLAEALESVRLQGDEGIEVIAVDDGSTDETPLILHDYALKMRLTVILRARAKNWMSATNHALRFARGTWASILHQDDLWEAGRADHLRGLTQRYPEASLLLHPSYFIDREGKRVGRWCCPLPIIEGVLSPQFITYRLLVQNFIAMPAPTFRVELARKHGGLDERFWYAADWDFWLKLVADGPILYHPIPLTSFRLHRESQTIVGSSRRGEIQNQLETILNHHYEISNFKGTEFSYLYNICKFSTQLNAVLASAIHGGRDDLLSLARSFLTLGPRGWFVFLHRSRLHERVIARIRAGLLRYPKPISAPDGVGI